MLISSAADILAGDRGPVGGPDAGAPATAAAAAATDPGARLEIWLYWSLGSGRQLHTDMLMT